MFGPIGRSLDGAHRIPHGSFINKTGKVAPEHKRLSRYGAMKLDEMIMALPVDDIATPTAHACALVRAPVAAGLLRRASEGAHVT
jgi:hypothetical protein